MKYKSKVLDEFFSDIHCPVCNMIVEHHVQHIDEEGNGEFTAYWAQCDICEHVEDYSEEDLFSK